MTVARGNSLKTSSASNFGRNNIEAPDISATLLATNSPCVWNTGSACSSTSAALNRQVSISACAFDDRLACVSIAPLERPVVPDV